MDYITQKIKHSERFIVICGIATTNDGSDNATPTFVVPTSNPTSLGLTFATLEYNARNSFAVTKDILCCEKGYDFWIILKTYLQLLLHCYYCSKREMAINTYHGIRRKCFQSAILFFLLFILGNGFPFMKMPIFWRELNGTGTDLVEGRRLHEYLSIFPTFGDSKQLGYLFSLVNHY